MLTKSTALFDMSIETSSGECGGIFTQTSLDDRNIAGTGRLPNERSDLSAKNPVPVANTTTPPEVELSDGPIDKTDGFSYTWNEIDDDRMIFSSSEDKYMSCLPELRGEIWHRKV